MVPSIPICVVLLVFAPFVAAAVAPLLFRLIGNYTAAVLALVPAAAFVWLCTLIATVAAGAGVSARFAWVPAYGIDLSFRLDGLSLVFALVISGVGTLIVLYAGAYLKGEPHLGRFLAFLMAFTGAMLGLVLADGLVALYGFWELTTLTSFLLIGFDHTRQAARRAAVQALLVTTGGGLALLLGALLLHGITGQWQLSAMAGQGAALTGHSAYPWLFWLFALGAFTKSAQVPFHFWLPNAMEAPTPVSAFLHSATMVQAGVYLLARLSPLLGGTPLWATTLVLIGGLTLAWGAVVALRQTDMKQMLAQSTVASLGLLVLLLGLGGEVATTAAIVYFLAHAFYKACLFLVVGLIDHETGVRDITALGGLRDKLALAFIAAILAGFSMLGLPPALGYLAKEEMYLGFGSAGWQEILLPLLLVAGNAGVGALALALVARPFLGSLTATPKVPHEGPLAMLVGPLLLGIIGIAAAVLAPWVGAEIAGPAVAAVTGQAVELHLGFRFALADWALWLSLATWGLSALLYWRLDDIRTVLRRLDGWRFDRGYDAMMAGLILGADRFVRFWQHGRLRLYLTVVFVAMAAALLWPLIGFGGLALPAGSPLDWPEWGVVALALAGLAMVLLARSLLFAILALGVQGTAMALIYLLFGAPDLSFTQFMVETLSVVMFALVMVRLQLDRHVRRPLGVAGRDAGLALLCGGGVSLLLLAILAAPFDDRLGAFFATNAATLAHGRNIVNVILVDFRGLDTLGEISVVMTAGIAILGLVAGRRRSAMATRPPDARRRGRAAPAAPANEAAS